nr:bestrophin family ion channel [Paraflavitalea speifideiaquila]
MVGGKAYLGAIVNESRTLARQVLSFTDNRDEDDDVYFFRERVIRRQIAWNYSLGQNLRGTPATQGLDRYLSKRELEMVSQYSNVPAALLEQHGRDLKRALENGWVNRYQQVELDRTISRLCEAMGKCERIKNTVFPHTYSLYIHFSLLLFIALLPFGVIEYFGFLKSRW